MLEVIVLYFCISAYLALLGCAKICLWHRLVTYHIMSFYTILTSWRASNSWPKLRCCEPNNLSHDVRWSVAKTTSCSTAVLASVTSRRLRVNVTSQELHKHLRSGRWLSVDFDGHDVVDVSGDAVVNLLTQRRGRGDGLLVLVFPKVIQASENRIIYLFKVS